MDKEQFFTLGLKLKRYNIPFQYDLKSETFEIGDVKNILIQKTLIQVGLSFLGIILIIIFFLTRLFDSLFFELFGVQINMGFMYVFFFLIAIILSIRKKYFDHKPDQFEKFIFNKAQIIVQKAHQEEVLQSGDIAQVSYSIHFIDKSDEYQGKIYMQTKDRKSHLLLDIQNESPEIIKADLEYIKNVIEDYLRIRSFSNN